MTPVPQAVVDRRERMVGARDITPTPPPDLSAYATIVWVNAQIAALQQSFSGQITTLQQTISSLTSRVAALETALGNAQADIDGNVSLVVTQVPASQYTPPGTNTGDMWWENVNHVLYVYDHTQGVWVNFVLGQTVP